MGVKVAGERIQDGVEVILLAQGGTTREAVERANVSAAIDMTRNIAHMG